MRRYKELILGAGITVLAAVYLAAALMMKINVATAFSSRVVPLMLGGGTLVVGILQCAAGLSSARKYKPGEDGEKSDRLVPLLMFAVMVGYVVILEPVGFLISTAVLLFAQIMLLSPKHKVNIPLFLVVSAGFSAATYYAFRYGLQLILPVGILG